MNYVIKHPIKGYFKHCDGDNFLYTNIIEDAKIFRDNGEGLKYMSQYPEFLICCLKLLIL